MTTRDPTRDPGSTATTLLITKDAFYFCNVGDSRSILAREKKVFLETKDHKPEDLIERRRIIAAGVRDPIIFSIQVQFRFLVLLKGEE